MPRLLGCYTAEQLAALSEDVVRALDEKIRERCRGAGGVYRLEQDEDLLIIPKPYVRRQEFLTPLRH